MEDVRRTAGNSAEDVTDEDVLRWAARYFIVVIFIGAVAVASYLLKFAHFGLSPKQDHWGQFGDFIGGLLNPLIGIVTIYLLLYNVRLQRRELSAALAEMKGSNEALATQNRAIALQTFDTNLFSWLASYRELVQSVALSRGTKDYRGRNALFAAFEENLGKDPIARVIVEKAVQPGDEYRRFIATATVPKGNEAVMESLILAQWDRTYKSIEHHLDTVFRTLYRLIRWIDEQPLALLNDSAKWHYVSLVRSQISQIEMLYLFFNGFTERGEGFNYLVDKYGLFDNLDINKDPVVIFLMTHTSHPYDPTAYGR